MQIYSYLKCIVYAKLLKPRQSFWITMYLDLKHKFYNAGILSGLKSYIKRTEEIYKKNVIRKILEIGIYLDSVEK